MIYQVKIVIFHSYVNVYQRVYYYNRVITSSMGIPGSDSMELRQYHIRPQNFWGSALIFRPPCPRPGHAPAQAGDPDLPGMWNVYMEHMEKSMKYLLYIYICIYYIYNFIYIFIIYIYVYYIYIYLFIYNTHIYIYLIILYYIIYILYLFVSIN